MLKSVLFLQKLQTKRNTPIHDLGKINNIKILVKLKSFNNLKARPAYYILKEAIKAGNINRDTIVVESSSGNFAILLAALCNQIGLKFVPVIDPNINPSYENLLHTLCSTVIKVSQRDNTGGFLKTRLATMKKFLDKHPNSYWTNQYNIPNNFKVHYLSLGEEIIKSGFNFDYIFIAVSALETITGVSKRIKESQVNCKTIAADANGSSILTLQPMLIIFLVLVLAFIPRF
ncbi:pyridoxal-phosphate dependent enzyme [Lactobacillus sp. ESL0233]|uniref:pyridoxal-phosphate dependent enzyme n=1 Tax=Lactobacillus sp. ESL0233 TaxID=2069354 RepID=UPI0021013CB4|nr:pyridoxal-phosphate dependent enzyme [Lactobacillus sp. ESL0233]